ncbi:hypothetical protein C6P46_003004 [Rhodotorula mucilaginosa]|uniref:Yeast cell wall synthesis Kre9/Knh1-like N-terminal domain-containing protein n=1 Tax=Rhodotorula mucilaginosa TaxID=5537 RepID=A0A9P6W5C5_RHOMI|nr:hypothetical protein C6P46_003004 [Rhodotorula mucilaginosa]
MRSVTQLGAGAALLVLSAAQAAYADVVPTAPGPGEVFRVGQKCNIQWDLDTTGTWTSFEIQLMTGSNLNMVVGSDLDGTTGPGTIDFTCPQVTPNADIYFYQFTQAGAPTSWTTRFTIAGADGSVTEPTETTAGIAWGTGKLVGAAAAAGSGSAAGSAAAGSSSSATGGSGLASLANTKTRVAAASSSTVAAAATTTTTASSTFVTSVTSSSSSSTSSEAAVATSSDTLTSLSPAAVIVTVTSSSSTASSAVGSAASNANLRSAAGRVGVSVGAAVAAGAAALSYALLA